ncbi:O-antigen ligase family protein [Phototrophicus methaneseepsis]|uniref:O-antigen ligase family protein n=1 Tax=Phototrophicus methaneseepsis TaxID=2710758 RepID=A0A7S8E813_9CHLR|nr:O-antigen ligase family protein [Phototrophicus methaneseepsis]QPC82037.1 O-antigen ligase family protein [Phototrophicus methaneseepsis]
MKSVRTIDILIFAIGLLLPLINLTGNVDTAIEANNIFSRIAIVDILVIFFLINSFIARQINISFAGKFYIYVLIFSCCLGLFFTASDPGLSSYTGVLAEFAALFMAFLYWILGYTIAKDLHSLKVLIAGIFASVYWQAIIVIHDFLFPTQQWFQSRLIGRVTGTFRNGAQLSVYGYMVTGIVFTFGNILVKKRWLLIVITGLLSSLFVIGGSRRTAIFAISVAMAIYLFLGLMKNDKRAYGIVVFLVTLGVGIVLGNGENLNEFFVVERIDNAFEIASDPDNFIFEQYESVFNNIGQWFPWGVGIGRNYLISPTGKHEMHSAYTSILVDLGVPGFVAFFWLFFDVFRQRRSNSNILITAAYYIVIAFLFSTFVMMIHGTLHRDRYFMLYLGLVSRVYLVKS